MLGDRRIVLMGGGRWGRIHAFNLSRILTPHDRVIWVSSHNQDQQRHAIAGFGEPGPQFDIFDCLKSALQEDPKAALVVNSPRDHFMIAAMCLRSGVHTFVEKPIAYNGNDARQLLDLARRDGLVLAVGLHLLSATYLHCFANRISGRKIARLNILWFDSVGETRYGEIKKADHATPIAHDIYPHIWSIVRVLGGPACQEVIRSSNEPDGFTSFELLTDGIVVQVHCGRGAPARKRKIDVLFDDGGNASLDFTIEPGVSVLDGRSLPSDPLWDVTPTPVLAEVMEFLNQVGAGLKDSLWPHLAAHCLGSVDGAEILNAQLNTPVDD